MWLTSDWLPLNSGTTCGDVRRGFGADDLFENRDKKFEGRSEEYTPGLHVRGFRQASPMTVQADSIPSQTFD